MNDRPLGADSQPGNITDHAPRRDAHTPLPNMEAPGKMTHSTPLNREKMMADLQNPERSEADDLMMKALMDNLKADNNSGQKMPNPLNLMEKKTNQPIQQPKLIKAVSKKDISQQQGFLMPFVNWFNGLFSGLKESIAKVMIKQPMTGRGMV